VTEEGPVTRFLSSSPLLVLGDLSFSIYMCHWPLIQVRNWLGSQHLVSDAMGTALAVLAIGLTSIACWKCIEVPARTWGRRLIDRRMD
jgi:peptidoglycan/LPS O-acetylase OafA/YrhL